MRTIFVGCGSHGGQTLLPAARSVGIEAAALVDADLERARALAGQWSVPDVYAGVQDLDPSRFQAAVIALPIAEQGAAARWALEHGLHTFVEKPPAPDLPQLRELAKLAGDADVVCRVGMNFRWAEGVRVLLSKLEDGALGQVVYARVVHIARKPVVPFGPDLSLEASLFHAQGIHAVDLAVHLMPGTTTVAGQMLAVQRGRLCVMAGQDLEAGTRFEANFGSCAAGFHHQLEVVTTTGDQLLLRDLSELVLVPGGGHADVEAYPGGRVLWSRSPIGTGYAGAGYAAELAAFQNCVQGGHEPRLATVEDLVPVYEAFESVLTSRGLAWNA